jgi:hypothetical protein
MTRTAVRTQVSITPPETKAPGAQMDAFETFVRHAPFAAALVDAGFRLTAVSPDWADHGLSPGLLLGDDFRRALVSPEDVDSLERCVAFGEAFSRYRSISLNGAEPRIWRTEFAATQSAQGGRRPGAPWR